VNTVSASFNTIAEQMTELSQRKKPGAELTAFGLVLLFDLVWHIMYVLVDPWLWSVEKTPFLFLSMPHTRNKRRPLSSDALIRLETHLRSVACH